MSVTRAALYVDFDNFFGGLIAGDPDAAVEVAMNPSVWLARLTREHSDDGPRRWLALRCYMNPAGWVANPRSDSDRLYFSKFRPYFVRAGFDVVDCPTLARGKNAADIRIVIDVMTALQGPARLDEFVLASSDADFTPLLHVVRAHDRLVTMIATGDTSSAYEALADRLLDATDIVDLLGTQPADEAVESLQDSPVATPRTNPKLEEAFRATVVAQYEAATEPINLAALASGLVKDLGPDLRGSNWLGAGGFLRALRNVDLPNVAFSHHFLWDTSRHTPPEPVTTDPATHEPATPAPDRALPPEVAKFCQVAGLPRIPQADWPRAFRYLEEYCNTQPFSLAEASKWTRNRSAESGGLIARAVFNFILTACHSQGTRLDVEPRATAEDMSTSLLVAVLNRAELAGIDVTEADKQRLGDWLGFGSFSVSACPPQ